MEKAKHTTEIFNDESSFNYKEWLIKIAHYWYLLLLGLIIAIGWAYLQNRSWKPQYKVEGQVYLGNTSSSSSYVFMQGFANADFSSKNDQLILFGRRELIRKALYDLPLTIEYFTEGRFKTNYYYKEYAPIEIKTLFIAPEAYEQKFQLIDIDKDTYEISLNNADNVKIFSQQGTYGTQIENAYFFGTISKNTSRQIAQLFFTFRSLESLENEFASRLSFSILDGTSVATVSLTGDRVQRDKDFLNALMCQFIQDNLDRKNAEANRTIEFLDEQLRIISDSLSISASSIRQFRRNNNILDVNTYVSDLLQQASSFESQKVAMDMKEAYFKYLEKYLTETISNQKILAPSTLGVSDPALLNLVNQFNDIHIKRAELGENNPYYQEYTRQLNSLKEALFGVLKNVHVIYEMERNNFYSQYEKNQKAIQSLPEKESQIGEIERLHTINDNYYTYLLQKRSEAQIRKASNISDNSVLQEANVSAMVNGNIKKHTYLRNTLICLLITLLIIILRETIDRRIKTVDEAEKITKLSVLTSIPYQKMGSKPLTVLEPKSIFTEAFRTLRTRIQFLTAKSESATILCTSSESADGKTFFSINLAGIYALSGKPTLLIDLDLRKPSIGKHMQLSADTGVSNVLIGAATIESAIIPKDTHRPFDVLLAGTIPPNPGELVASPQMQQLLQQLEKRYQYIIIDTSPIGLVVDAYPLTKIVDLTLFVIFANKTDKKFLKEITSTMQRDKINNLYAIFNGIKEKKNMLGSKYYQSRNNKYYRSLNYFNGKEQKA